MKKKLAIVLSCYNEEDNIQVVYKALKKELDGSDLEIEYIFVDDGSIDKTFEICRDLSLKDTHVKVVKLSRNYGHEIAMTAGLDAAKDADAVIFMDSDMQHPPKVVPKMIKLWEEGAEVVLTKRKGDLKDSLSYKILSKSFYKVLNLLSSTRIESDTPDFRLIDKTYIQWLRQFQEPERLLRGLLNWITPSTNCAVVQFDVGRRFAGESKYNFKKSFALAWDSILQFSVCPLLMPFYAAMVFFFLSVFAFIIALCSAGKICGIVALILFIAGLQFLFMGTIGSYLAKVHVATKRRPLYFARIYKNGDIVE